MIKPTEAVLARWEMNYEKYIVKVIEWTCRKRYLLPYELNK